jgi:hypothetical protein
MPELFWNTVDPTLRAVLADTMIEPLFEPFRLVGGTALSLQLGHRKSVDIDPICLRGKHWEIIKLDLLESVHE